MKTLLRWANTTSDEKDRKESELTVEKEATGAPSTFMIWKSFWI